MLSRNLDKRTIRMVKERADFFFAEQCKRLGPIESYGALWNEAVNHTLRGKRNGTRTNATGRTHSKRAIDKNAIASAATL
jgi:hypothetical protein